MSIANIVESKGVKLNIKSSAIQDDTFGGGDPMEDDYAKYDDDYEDFM